MQKALQRVFSFFIKTSPPRKGNRRKSKGQSLVEVAISFPILIILFSGVVEFGFILNYYLSLLDATRDAARLYSGGDPFDSDHFRSPFDADTFYYDAAFQVQRILDPVIDKPTYKGRRILLDPTIDDVIVSVYSASSSQVKPCRSPAAFHLFPTWGAAGNQTSMFNTSTISNAHGSGDPDEGFLVVEVHYKYHQVLGLPWMKPFDPIILRAYTIMPIRAAEPPSCP
jgi:hypothetical protein